MALKNKGGSLTPDEKRVVKALLNDNWRNQDVHALVNTGRSVTVNFGRISGVKSDKNQKVATREEVEFFKIKKNSYNPQTGLNLIDDERLIRSREAMVLAVQLFNSAAFHFKTEIFAVLANIAWTYLLHEHYRRKQVAIVNKDGNSLLLSQMVEREDCPLSDGTKNNLRSLKVIRDDVEHKVLGKGDTRWLGLFQACCLNFDRTLCELFGAKLSLAHELAFAIQFSKLDMDQVSMLNKFEIPAHIEALDARLLKDMTEEQVNDLHYAMKVIYTLDQASKGRAHHQFVRPESIEGKDIRNVLVQYRSADIKFPHKPKKVVRLVTEKSGQKFSLNNHSQAWRLYKVRPESKSVQPENTDKDYCIYHVAHRDYTYSDAWVDRLVDAVKDDTQFAAIKGIRLIKDGKK